MIGTQVMFSLSEIGSKFILKKSEFVKVIGVGVLRPVIEFNQLFSIKPIK